MKPAANPFEDFFKNPVYLEFKSHAYNYRLRRNAVQKQLKNIPPGLILEIGSGVSIMSEGGTQVIFSDITSEAVEYLCSKGIAEKALVMSITNIAIKRDSIDTILCSEVLEHIPDDQKALQEMLHILKPSGSLILTVPIHPRYFAFDDKFVHHRRRYEPAKLLNDLQKEGFEIIQTQKVTGLLDKITYLVIAWVYAHSLLKDSNRKSSSGKQFLLKAFLPFYKIFNKIYAVLVSAEAKIMPLATTAVLLIHCRKK